jgi:hypothetical protein
MKFIDREQAKVVAGFGSTTRANVRLLALVRAGLLKQFFAGTTVGGSKAVYRLSPKGAGLIGAPAYLPGKTRNEILIADPFFEHRQQINAVYLAVKYGPIPAAAFRRWISFRASLSASVRLIPDGYFELANDQATYPMFLEVDRGTEPLGRWKAKTSGYIKLAVSGEFERRFGQPQFRVLAIAPSSRRLNTIRTTVGSATDKVFWFTTFDLIEHDGLWAPVWLRPRGAEMLPLLNPYPCATATNAAA